MINYIKRVLSRPFKFESRSACEILLYKLTTKIAAIAYRLKFRKSLQRTDSYIKQVSKSNQMEKKSAFVFANGPSLSSIDLLKIKKYCESGAFDLIAINSFMSKSAHVVKPRFAVFADNVHFAGGDTQYSRDIESCKDLHVTYFAPAKYVNNTDDKQYGYCSICDIDSKNTENITRPLGTYGVTAFWAIALAKTLGYQKIYICGFDNSYFKDFEVGTGGDLFINHRHYYNKEGENIRVPCLYGNTSEFFFDVYRHFAFLEKLCAGNDRITNIAQETFLSSIPRSHDLDIYH